MSRPVIVGYGAGASGDAALRLAATEARLRHASVTIFHKPIGAEAPEVFGHEENAVGTGQGAVYHLLRAARDVMPDIDRVDVRIVTGPIAEELVIASQSASMIVLGVTTNHPATAAALDTVPREVARRSQCPVLVVPAGTTATSSVEVVCGINRSEASINALRWAADEAALRGVAVHAVEVLAQHLHRHSSQTRVVPLSDWVQNNVPLSATTVLCSTELGSPARHLVGIAEQRRALLVIGGHQRTGVPHRSVAATATSQTRVPVAVVPLLALSETPMRTLAH